MRILLVRHGESQANVDPTVHRTTSDHAIPLSARGETQAREAGRRIDAYYENAIGDVALRPRVGLWTSPYDRTRRTADLLFEAAGR